VTAAAAGRGVRETAAGFAGRDAVCGIAATPEESTRIAIESIKAGLGLRMSYLRAWGHTSSVDPNVTHFTEYFVKAPPA